MSVFSLFNIFDPDRITVVSVISTHYLFCCFLTLFLSFIGGGFLISCVYNPDGSMVKNPLAMPETQKTWVQSLCQEDPLGEGMATHCSILAWRTPWIEEPGGLQSMGSQS